MVVKNVSALILLVSIFGATVMTAAAQEAPTSTPLTVQLVTSTPNSAGGDPALLLATATWTPTAAAPVQLEPLDIANVRALPSTDEAQLGVIRSGETYTITGRYENWYQFQYDPAPNRTGWVYGELISVIGDASVIPLIDPYAQPTVSAVLPTSDSAILPPGTGGVVATASGQDGIGGDNNAPALPTFTYPPGVTRPLPTDPGAVSTPESGGGTDNSAVSDTPPILPVLVLGGLGILGLAFSSMRR